MSGDSPSPAERALLAAVLLVAAALRFTGLGWGLRHPPHVDEAVYVDNVVLMVKAGDLDHRFYTYPGLFFYLLAPGIAMLGPEEVEGSQPYLLSRALVAAVGVANVLLLYAVGARLATRGTGLLAAALLAVSPVDVETSHQVRPDVLLEGFGIAAIYLFARLGSRWRDDLRAGALIGLATAVKFTGLLMVPFYALARLVRPGPRWRGLATVAVLSVVIPLLFTPYALLHFDRYRGGPAAQMAIYYGKAEAPSEEGPAYSEQARFYLGHVGRALGPLGAGACLLGAFLLVRRSWRDIAPALLHPLTVLAVMSTAAVGWPRLILPGMGILYLGAAYPIATWGRRIPLLGAVLAAAMVAPPLLRSMALVNLLARPSPADEALDWIAAYVPAGSRLLETRIEAHRGRGGGLELGIDPARHEVVTAAAGEQDAAIQRLVPHFDFVIADRGRGAAWLGLLQEQHRIRFPRQPSLAWPLGVPERGPVAIRLLAPRTKTNLVEMDLGTAVFTSSENAEALVALRGGSATGWSTLTPARGGEWIEVAFSREAPVAAIGLLTSAVPPFPRLLVEGAAQGEAFRPLRAVEARPPLSTQVSARARGSTRPLGFRFLLEGRALGRLRVVQTARLSEPWTVAALEVYEPSPLP